MVKCKDWTEKKLNSRKMSKKTFEESWILAPLKQNIEKCGTFAQHYNFMNVSL